MSMQDPVADMLTSIRNAQTMGIIQIKFPFSRLKSAILRVMKEEGYIIDFEVIAVDSKKYLQVSLKYYQGRPVVEKIKRISRPGLRIYKSCKDLPVIRGGLGVAIVSTPKGVMTEKSARSHQVGGEILCTIE